MRSAARRVGARELVAESLRRIEALDPAIGAVVALRAEEALDEAIGLDAHLAARRRRRPARRPAAPREGHHRCRRDAHHARVAAVRGRTGGDDRCAGGRPPPRRRRHRRGQGERARVRVRRLHHEPRVRPDAEPVEPRTNPGRFERRVGGRARGRHGLDRDGDRHRRVDPDPGRVLRAGRTEADERRGPSRPGRSRDGLDRHDDRRAARPHGRRRPPPARRARGHRVRSSGPRAPSRLFVLERWVPRMPLPAEDAGLFEDGRGRRSRRRRGSSSERADVSELFHGAIWTSMWSLIAAPELVGILGGRAAFEAVAQSAWIRARRRSRRGAPTSGSTPTSPRVVGVPR